MSEAADKSHIPDSRLIPLTSEKMEELQRERNVMSDELQRLAGSSDSTREHELERAIEEHDRAYEKLSARRAGMVDGADRGNGEIGA